MNLALASIEVTVRGGPMCAVNWSAPHGATVADLVRDAPGLPVRDGGHVRALVGGLEVPPAMWARVRPHAGVPVRLVAMPGKGDMVGTAFRFLSAALMKEHPMLGLMVGVGAGLLFGTKGAKKKQSGGLGGLASQHEDRSAGTSINPLEPGATLWSVVGKDKVAPQLVAGPYVDQVGADQVVHLLFAVASTLDWRAIRVNGVDIAEQRETIEYETREGLPGDAPSRLVTRSAHAIPLGLELSEYRFLSNKPEQMKWIADHGVPHSEVLAARPKWHALGRSARDAEQIWLPLFWPNGFNSGNKAGASMLVRMRLRGPNGKPRNLPEFYLRGGDVHPVRYMIKLIFSRNEPAAANPSPGKRCYATRRRTAEVNPGNALPGNGPWEADPYFDRDGTGGHVFVHDDRMEVYLDPEDWPGGGYDVEMIRGLAFQNERDYGDTSYMDIVADNAHGFYVRFPQWAIASRLVVESMQSIRSDYPVKEKGLALLAIRAKTRVNKVEAIVQARCPVHRNGNWDTIEATSNVAAWAREKLTGAMNADPLPRSLLADDEWAAWYGHCEREGLEINMTLRDETVEDFLSLCEMAGEAKKKRGALWGYWIDRDRSDEPPAQLLTPLNTRGVSWARSYETDIKAYVVQFRDAGDDYRAAEIRVYLDDYGPDRRGGKRAVTREQVKGLRLPGAWTRAEAERRATYLLREIEHRSIVWKLGVGIEHETLERGDLVGVAHDLLERRSGWARVKRVLAARGKVTGLELDAELRLGAPGDGPPWLAANAWALGNVWRVSRGDAIADPAVAVRLTDKTVMTRTIEEGANTKRVTFAQPFPRPETLKEGCLAVAGSSREIYRRMIVSDIKGGPDDSASLVLMPEANEIHT